MRLFTLVEHCGQLINIIYKSHLPSDRNATDYFRSKKHIGSKERRFISETVFSILRNILLLQNINEHILINVDAIKQYFNQKHDYFLLVLMQIILAEKSPNEFIGYCPSALYTRVNSHCTNIMQTLHDEFSSANMKNADEWIEAILHSFNMINNNSSSSLEVISNRFSFPSDLLTLFNKSDDLDVYNLAKELNKPAKPCIRINSLNTTRSQVSDYLTENNISHSLGLLSPQCIVLNNRYQLTELTLYTSGGFEIQDESSQLVAFCVDPEENDSILDACAGAGGKSLHLANLQNDNGRITATDIEFMRLKEINFRAKRCGISSINSILLKAEKFSKSISKSSNSSSYNGGFFDIVLVDAPCSGAGTIRREPMKKYTINERAINKICEQQYSILSNFSKFVKPGGVLVYSTCSIISQENNEIISRFLDNYSDFSPEPIAPHLKKYGINIQNLSDTDHTLTLYPHIHNTDGFFISRMRRN